MSWRCQDCDYLGEEIIKTEEHDEGCPECGGYCLEFSEMTDEEEKNKERFFNDNLDCFIVPNNGVINHNDSYSHQLLWDDYKAAKAEAEKTGVYVYTVVECDGDTSYILDGWHYVNRAGYYLTTEEIYVGDGIRLY